MGFFTCKGRKMEELETARSIPEMHVPAQPFLVRKGNAREVQGERRKEKVGQEKVREGEGKEMAARAEEKARERQGEEREG